MNLIGRRFGRLTVIKRTAKYKWLCHCDCGVKRIVIAGSLTRRDRSTKSCGCMSRDRLIQMNTKHGFNDSPEHQIWIGIRKRCLKPNDRNYKNYGGRGIMICQEWRNNFPAFLRDVGKRPISATHRYTIERIDNEGNYEPGNVRWATYPEQRRNTRKSVFLVFHGQVKVAKDWAIELGLHPNTLYGRLII